MTAVTILMKTLSNLVMKSYTHWPRLERLPMNALELSRQKAK